jgi:hypothetical protein
MALSHEHQLGQDEDAPTLDLLELESLGLPEEEANAILGGSTQEGGADAS